jgi:hypothetical protein
VISVQESGSEPTITSSIWRRIPMGIAGLGGCGVPFKVAELQVGENAEAAK